MWDERYKTEDYVYGLEPNDFLLENVDQLKPGSVLCLAEGEGRNAVFLAKQGFDVTAMDGSSVGLEKAQRLASENEVEITTVHADLNEFTIEPNAWDNIISIFCHIPPPLREKVHAASAAGLTKGGVLLLEAYTPKQLEFGTGGPPVEELLMSLEGLIQEFQSLEIFQGLETERDVHEGRFHNGRAAVVQLLARK
ncbi:class I SAM-dependent methyltransferase [Pontiellaceae bacterium B1224]|nr:class I SAM-dependent methyltransferase [Pontiellaceae bacterium B1224]